MPPLIQVRAVRSEVGVFNKFEKVTLGIFCEDRCNSCADLDRFLAHQFDAGFFQSHSNCLHVDDDKGDVGNPLPVKHPLWNLILLERNTFRLDQLDSLSIWSLKANNPKA